VVPEQALASDQPVGQRGEAISCLVSGGCIISGARVENAIILPNADVGCGARLRNVIVEKGARRPPGLVVGEDPVEDGRRFRRIENGICLITQPMIDRLSA
jgi:glucose-1-phosphate adenylyltransferase